MPVMCDACLACAVVSHSNGWQRLRRVKRSRRHARRRSLPGSSLPVAGLSSRQRSVAWSSVAVLIALAPAAVLQFCSIRLCCLPAEGTCRAASRQQLHAPTALLCADLCVVCVLRVCLQGQGHTASDAQSTWRNHTLALFIKTVKKKSALVKAVKAEFLLTPAATAGQQWKDPREGGWPFERERG
eukprot:COSAG06_NODE_9220_length_1955_cov_1.355065_2_plen_185_part_00